MHYISRFTEYLIRQLSAARPFISFYHRSVSFYYYSHNTSFKSFIQHMHKHTYNNTHKLSLKTKKMKKEEVKNKEDARD